MNNTEKLLCLTAKLMVLGADKEHNAQEILRVSNELNALSRELNAAQPQEELMHGFVKFNNKEISLMPIKFRKIIRIEGCVVQAYKRQSGAKKCVKINYELRYRRNGYNVYASSNDLETAKQKFIEALHLYERGGSAVSKVPTAFDGFTEYYFENFRKRKISAATLKNDKNRYNLYLKSFFGTMRLKDITPALCQNLLDEICAAGKFKTKDEIHSLLNLIFKAAIAHGIISRNPLDLVVYSQHERVHGHALAKDEEKRLLASTKGTPYELMFAVGLYTGMRPNEYSTARIDGLFIKAVNSKRKNGKVEYKKIPITPMLRPYLNGVTELKFYCVNRIREKFHTVFPNKKLYDLRTTFYTRCEECGVAPAARDEFVGHSRGKLGNAYTDLSDEFLYSEGQKLDY